MASVRKFIRHPSGIPIQVTEIDTNKSSEGIVQKKSHVNNVSLGGLAFFSSSAMIIDKQVLVSIPCIDIQYEVIGRVLWCKELDSAFEIGLEFDDAQQVFQLRMIEQICHIEHYRKELERVEGRKISSEQAAIEWIDKYASSFPKFDSFKN
ncbi:MAG: PilZ domain-containing protein [Gammaproteobacteria bacterium]|nr:PilZ domain-containing protein [Gammaproteobacteria bacterium]